MNTVIEESENDQGRRSMLYFTNIVAIMTQGRVERVRVSKTILVLSDIKMSKTTSISIFSFFPPTHSKEKPLSYTQEHYQESITYRP